MCAPTAFGRLFRFDALYRGGWQSAARAKNRSRHRVTGRAAKVSGAKYVHEMS